MATNPYVNKVVYNNNTLIDLTSDTVTAATLKKGETAHDASGAAIVGTMEGGGPQPGELRWSTCHFDPGDNGADSRTLKVINLEGKPKLFFAYAIDPTITRSDTKNIDVMAWVDETGRGFSDNPIDSMHSGNRTNNNHFENVNHLVVTWFDNDHGVSFKTDSSTYGYFGIQGGYDCVYLNDGTWS